MGEKSSEEKTEATEDVKKSEYQKKMTDNNFSKEEADGFLGVSYRVKAKCDRCYADQEKLGCYPKSSPDKESRIVMSLRNETIDHLAALKIGCFKYGFTEELQEIDAFLQACDECGCESGRTHAARIVEYMEFINKAHTDMVNKKKVEQQGSGTR